MSDVRTLEGARWSCRSCAACCHGLEYGPVEAETIEGLIARDIGARWPLAAERAWYEERPEGFFLATVDGHCIFLRDDNLCAVHAEFGEAAKPGFCREFPFHVVEEPRGPIAVVRPQCAGWHHSFRDGDVVDVARAQEVLDLPRVVPRRRFEPDEVEALPGVRVPLVTWLAWEDRLLAATVEESARAGVARLRDGLAAEAGVTLPEPDPVRFRQAAMACLELLRRVLATVPDAGPPHQVAFLHDARARLTAAQQGLIADAVDVDADTASYQTLLLRSFVLSKQWTGQGDVFGGLGLFLLGCVQASAQAASADPAAFSDGLTPWLRLSRIRMVEDLLRKAHPALVDLVLHA